MYMEYKKECKGGCAMKKKDRLLIGRRIKVAPITNVLQNKFSLVWEYAMNSYMHRRLRKDKEPIINVDGTGTKNSRKGHCHICCVPLQLTLQDTWSQSQIK